MPGDAGCGIQSRDTRAPSTLPAARVRGALGRVSELLADRPHGLLADRALEAVEVQVTVQMVDLVLQAAGHELGALDDDLLAVEILADDARVPGATGGVPQTGHGQAALVAVLEVVGELADLRVEHVADLVVDVPREGAEPDADVVRGETSTTVVVDRLDQVDDERAHTVIDGRDRVARCPQDRVSDRTNLSHRHVRILSCAAPPRSEDHAAARSHM